MGFRFRLAAVLRHRRRVEEIRALALAGTRRQHGATAARLAAVEDALASGRGALLDAGRRGTTGAELARLADGVATERRRALATADRLRADEAAVETARADLVVAARDHRLVQRLEQLGRARHRAALDAAARRELDDIAGAYHLWRRRGRAGGER